MIYFASPFTDPDQQVERQRYISVRNATAHLLSCNYPVFSPIVYGYEMHIHNGLSGSMEFWKEFNASMLRRSTVMYVLMLPGYEQSTGILWEAQQCYKFEIPIRYYSPADIFALTPIT